MKRIKELLDFVFNPYLFLAIFGIIVFGVVTYMFIYVMTVHFNYMQDEIELRDDALNLTYEYVNDSKGVYNISIAERVCSKYIDVAESKGIQRDKRMCIDRLIRNDKLW